MKLRHPNCKHDRCRVCMEDHTALDVRLTKETGDNRVDHLGKYHKWLADNGINPETEHGWATMESFDEKNIMNYVAWYKGVDNE